MKNIITLFILNLFAGALLSQNISFSVVIDASNAPTTSVAQIFAATSAGSESLTGETIVIYYDDTQSTIDASSLGSADLNLTPTTEVLGWDPASNTLSEVDVAAGDVPAGFDPGINKRIQLDLSDADDFVGSTITTTPTLLAEFTFNSVEDGAPISIGDGVMTDAGSAIYVNSVLDGLGSHPISIDGDQSSVLPIVLKSFDVSKRDERSVNLNWSTSSEINGSHFDVQRSQNLTDWSTIGTVKAIGESTTEQNYNLVDKDLPLSARSTKYFYYRLNMVDNDGSQEHSEVRTVRFNQDGADFIVYPNPSINDVFVNLSSITTETGPATMNVMNTNGQLVKQVTLSTNDDIRVDVSDFTAGTYFFIVSQNEKTFTQKIIKID